MKFKIIETKTVPTIQIKNAQKKIIIHSKYDPLREAKTWCAKEANTIKKDEPILVIGLGAGYHIQQLAKLNPFQEITVIEFNESFYNWFKQMPFNNALKQLNNVSVMLFKHLSNQKRNELFTSVSISNLLIHKSGLDLLPAEFKGVKNSIEDIIMQKKSLSKQIDYLNTNFKKNLTLKDNSISNLKGFYENKPIILVSAGPSLDKQLPFLKQISMENNFIIGAVGTAVKPLLKAEIIPDFFMVIDPNIGTYSQLTEVDLPNTPLYYLSTAYHDTVLLHKGPRKIVFQSGFHHAEEIARKKGTPLIQTGGSVATALLDLIVYFGGKSIALIGQDLAYTGGKTHAKGAPSEKEVTGIQKVMNYYQTDEIETANNLNLYRKWLERYAREHPNLQLYNCTEGGAYIENWSHIPLQDFYKHYTS